MRRGVIALALVPLLVACGGKSGPTDAQKDEAHSRAGIYCSFDPSLGSIYSDAFARCVKDREAYELERIVQRDAKRGQS